ncbi:adenylate/guanylate cyclase domain-containing protein [Spirochaeta isovalerica]|uniref:Adenylate cyclase n=1 Tax=Spirochaeta isovalerica TaxID=150 RepID=A0A841RBE4_9SPIO|nr:adenylate/guanylate cyclase domain-containing protein [Spirochaeta isovalerica]MBB6479732.1 adenylate cyclase [Spirochaeta isovalerica]
MKKVLTALVVPLISAALFSGLLFTEFYRGLDSKLYDLMLRIRPGIHQDERLLIVDVDDRTITNINMYPLSRDIFADGIILMKEFNPFWAVLDIEFVDRSPAGINLDVMNRNIPEEFDRTFSDIQVNQESLFHSLLEGRFPIEEAGPIVGELSRFTLSEKDRLYEEVQKIARDNDEYLGLALSYFGNVTATVNMMDEEDPTITDELRSYTEENFPFKDKLEIDGDGYDPFSESAEIKPSIMKILSRSTTAGFPRVEIDPDGVRRRVDLIYRNKENYYGQLGFMTYWNMSGRPSMATDGRSLHLKGKEITIPLTQDGRMFIHWPKANYIESFRHLSFYDLYRHDLLMDDLFYNLKLIEQEGLLGYPYYDGDINIMDYYRELESYREQFVQAGDGTAAADYREARDYLLGEVASLLNGTGEEMILQDIEVYGLNPDLSEDQRIYVEDLKNFVPEVFSSSRNILASLQSLRSYLDETIDGSISVLGYSGTSTTDIGVNPFEEGYMNVGLYASVINTLIQRDFLRDIPIWLSAVITLIIAVLTTLIVFRLKPGPGVAAGLLMAMLSFVLPALYFYYRGTYINILPPILATVSAFLATVILNLFRESREKGFIRGAFSHYLSTDVITELIDDPSRLALGGEERELTAIFTDIKGFSTISEKLTPTELVSLLNLYLTEMSDIIMEEKGTIDKYEGDAIISFFGAPLQISNHAEKACMAALKMRDAEKSLNIRLIDQNITPSPILTRIGINTGPMVVGNMGTSKKMDYTIMGSDVNLASRLEGVNKQYGTQILISGATKKQIGDAFVTRELDKVRVVGIQRPVTIYELCGFRKQLSEDQLRAYEIYHQALEFFRAKKWAQAEEFFHMVTELIHNDGPSDVFIKRCKQYSHKAPPADWDGVYNLVKK